MGRAPTHKRDRSYKKKQKEETKCERQFPDCPPEPNDKDCKGCPFYKS